VLATIVLRSREQILERNLNIISSNLQVLREFFTRHDDIFQWREPSAGSVCFPMLKRVPGGAINATLTAIDVETYCNQLVSEHGIMLLPASVYTSCDLPCFRLGFGRVNLPEIVARWEQSL
jgi:aspartate/methionine/tyrosine aminotransferase